MSDRFKFNRMEVAGALGDLGTILPLGIGMIVINGLFLLFVGLTGVMTVIGKYTPRPVTRGVQLSTGVLLVFAGSQLALTILDLKGRKEFFVSLTMVGITLASNLAVGFIAGIALAYALKSERLTV